MKAIQEIENHEASKIKYVLCDIDDTITTDGKLTAEAYSTMQKLSDSGIHVIPVTGRPAGWCDMIIRQWPVKAVIGENGAFVYYVHDGDVKMFVHPSVAQGDIQGRLEKVKQACLKGVEGCCVSKDQFCRIYDLAIDFNEDVHIGLEAGNKIKNICERMGAVAKVSSIHVNTWFGDYNKVAMAEMFLKKVLNETEIKQKVFYCGDSPNDEPMFEYFEYSCAVANIKPFIKDLTHLPTYVTNRESGQGFIEAIDVLFSRKEAI